MKETRTIILEGKELEYTLERKKVKNLNLRISPDCTIYVSANNRIPLSEIEGFLEKHSEMVLKSVQKFEKTIRGDGLECYVTGEVFYYLGTPRDFVVEEGWDEEVILGEHELKLVVRDADDFKHKERKMNAWRRKQYEEILAPRFREGYQKFRQIYDVPEPQLQLRAMNSKWGWCKPRQNVIALNVSLVCLPEECIWYIIFHELSHLIEANHSREFYRVVAQFMPDYKRWEQLLKKYRCR